MSDKLYELYVRDLATLVKEKAIAARRVTDDAAKGASDGYALGCLMAWHEIVSLMQQQAQAFDIPLESIGLADIDPEAALL